ARAVLTAERTMLNFLSFLSGIATRTKKYVDKVKAYNVKILDTRKTFPLLRYLEKYAVSVGGGYNHRMNLGEMVMVKDNHIAVHSPSLDFARDRQSIVHSLRSKAQKNIKIEIEVQSLEQFEDTLKQMPDIIMLDNMSTEDIKKAVRIRNESEKALRDTVLEVSGGITLDNVEDYAKTGIDTISIGAITDSVRSIDFSLNVL
ncbi:MAG: carboxylating nicotinate-nucleotide diphosphorylase, partial [Candidatus Omnitrophica bacterium]|nr:carboxylating nicotinate-nucleotide diphosphorylase [Candidatus Omnitrophota bacterium]